MVHLACDWMSRRSVETAGSHETSNWRVTGLCTDEHTTACWKMEDAVSWTRRPEGLPKAANSPCLTDIQPSTQ